jgi:hypothetical protein
MTSEMNGNTPLLYFLPVRMCRCCHRYKTGAYWSGSSKPKNIEEWCFCQWKRKSVPVPEALLPSELQPHLRARLAEGMKELTAAWWPEPICISCIKVHFKPLLPGHAMFPPHAKPGEAWYIDDMGWRHKFLKFSGPKAAIPDPALIDAKMKELDEGARKKLQEAKEKREAANKIAEEALAKELKEIEEHENAAAFSVLPGSDV